MFGKCFKSQSGNIDSAREVANDFGVDGQMGLRVTDLDRHGGDSMEKDRYAVFCSGYLTRP